MTEGADDGAALPCSPWAGDAADCCWGDGVLSQALRGRSWWSLLDLGGAIPMSSSGRVCPSVLISCSWSDSDRSWSKCLRGIRGISSKISTRHHQPIPKVEYCCRRKVWLLAKLTVSLCKIMFLAYYFKIYKEAWNSPWITTVKGLLLFFLWPNQVQGGSFQPGSVSHYGVYIVIIARNKGQHLQRQQALNVDFPRRFYLQIVIKGLQLFHWKMALLEFGLRWHLLSLVTFACELSPF